MKNRPLFRILIVDDIRSNRCQYADLVLNQEEPESPRTESGRVQHHSPGRPGKSRQDERPMPWIRTEVAVAADGEEAFISLDEARKSETPFNVLVCDLFMDNDGVWLLNELVEKNFETTAMDVFLVSRRDASSELAQKVEEARKIWQEDGKGYFDVILREDDEDADPLEHERVFLNRVWARILERIERSWKGKKTSVTTQNGSQRRFRTSNPQLKSRIDELFDKYAKTDVPILITGESGTGKTILAEDIHIAYGSAKPFEELNSAIPEDMLESDMFGHKKGAFTGALEDRKGSIELADGGTLFLDEICEMSKGSQVKLLKALEQKKFKRLGGERWISSQFRLITATNKNIKEEIEKGRFGNDLYHRINQYELNIPPLRERKEDIAFLVDVFWQKEQSPFQPAREDDWEPDAVSALVECGWDGNGRELEKFIGNLKILYPSDRITSDIIEQALKKREERSAYPGLNTLEKPQQRTRHIQFYPAMEEALSEATGRNEASRKVQQLVLKRYYSHFGDDEATVRKKIAKAFENHRVNCDFCKDFWEKRW